MINEGRTFLATAPWISVFPGLGIMGAVLPSTCSATASATSWTRAAARF